MASAINTDSLVKYETAILVSSSFTSNKSPSKKKALPAKDAARNEDYLNRILPPQEIIENNQLWVRYVSPTPATSADVSNLRKELDRKLESLGARDSGICPVREELHIQCFDELIRQITINCAERGYLLVRVRDEFRMVKHSLQSLYDSSIAYGLKKALMGEAEKEAMKTRQLQLEKENRDLQDQI
jgi:dynein light intermediate chain